MAIYKAATTFPPMALRRTNRQNTIINITGLFKKKIHIFLKNNEKYVKLCGSDYYTYEKYMGIFNI